MANDHCSAVDCLNNRFENAYLLSESTFSMTNSGHSMILSGFPTKYHKILRKNSLSFWIFTNFLKLFGITSILLPCRNSCSKLVHSHSYSGIVAILLILMLNSLKFCNLFISFGISVIWFYLMKNFLRFDKLKILSGIFYILFRLQVRL